MPILGELAKRRDILKYIGVAAVGAAVPTAFLLGRSSVPPSAPETPRPTVFIPELATPPPVRPPTPRPTEKPKPTELPGKVWEIPVRDIEIPFHWTGSKLFIVNSRGIPAEVDPKTGKQTWEWERKGVVITSLGKNIYLFNYESFRGYVLDADTKQELFKYNLPGVLFGNMAPSEQVSGLVALQLAAYNGGLAFKTSEGFALANLDGKEKVVHRGRLLHITNKVAVYSRLNPNSYSQVATTFAETLGDFKPVWSEEDIYVSLIDDKNVVYNKYDRSGRAQSNTFVIRSLAGGEDLKTIELPQGITPSFLSKDILILEASDWYTSPGTLPTPTTTSSKPTPTKEPLDTSNTYRVLTRNGFREITKFPKERNIPYKFISRDNWTFATHPRNGTKAFKDGGFVWENEDLTGLTHPTEETEGKLVFGTKGSHNPSGNREDGIWVVDAKTGKKENGFPIVFDELSTEPKVLGDKVIVADGIAGKRFGLNVLDITIRSKTRLLTDLFVSNLEKLDSNLVLAQTGGLGQKLYLFRV